MVTTPSSKQDNLSFPLCCLSLDLEVDRRSSRIRAFGAVRSDTGQACSGSGSKAELSRLDEFAEGVDFLLGHNLIAFDVPHLTAAMPHLRLLKLPLVDTLRLSPLAFPRSPYHHLVKHYQDGGLRRGRINDPELDARIALEVFEDECRALREAASELLVAWHWLSTPQPNDVDQALDSLFSWLRDAPRPTTAQARQAIGKLLENRTCRVQGEEIVARENRLSWSLSYVLAWLSVAGDNSVMPPWVRHEFPEAGRWVRQLRDLGCTDPACDWCREHHDARRALKRWFGFDNFRPEPRDDQGHPLQQSIVEESMAGGHVLGILPTGTGKSLCYQLPALSRYHKTGALTVVISPLVALMADQVAGLEARGIGSCFSINGLLSMPERADVLDKVRLGDAGILLISPEQLRSRSLRRVLEQRQIGGWVLDEAHCLSRWGHDFRTDYRYVGRFIKEKAVSGFIPPVMCLTATAKPDVVDEIRKYFRDQLDIDLKVFDGGTSRANLVFEVMSTTGGEKLAHIHYILMEYLPAPMPGGAIIYCATRRRSEEVAQYLHNKDLAVAHFHGGLPPETKKDVQKRFIHGDLRAIAATNAFGMGIDKQDVRLVIHADIPGSLENYLQEAGRAGRDGESARCVLLYNLDDVEQQFKLSAHSRLTRRQIQAILRALRHLNRKKRCKGEVVATAGEILGEDEDGAFQRDSTTDDTRVRTALTWLEESMLLTREENVVHVFPSSLKVHSVEEARKRLDRRRTITKNRREELLKITQRLMNASPDEGVTTDELMGIAGLSPEGVQAALHDLEQLGIAHNDTAITAFVHKGVVRSSRTRFQDAVALETALLDHMREAAPEQGKGDTSFLHLRQAAQILRDQDLPDPLPERLWRIVRGIAYDGQDAARAGGSWSVRKQDMEMVRVTMGREWSALEETVRRRHMGANCLLDHLLSPDCLPPEKRGVDLLAATTTGKLLQAINQPDLLVHSKVRDPRKCLDRALMWLHELDIIRIHKGLIVFRPAMTVHLLEQQPRRGFTKVDFEPLDLHYRERVLQVHVMKEFAERGLADMSEALRLAMDYFTMGEDRFLARWLPDRDKEIRRQTTSASWQAIVESLKNPVQRRIVADTREQTNVLVLAGPGSGKTRVLVHRIAYLVRVRREPPRSIVALAYNRHAAVEIRHRLAALLGNDARGVTVLTCHGLSMRLAGASFNGRMACPDNEGFRDVIRRAVDVLRGKDLPVEEADARREQLLAGFRWILVDEYQDIDSDQYELISALAGRTMDEDAGKLTLFAVGDDDQNIYSFKGASVEFIHRFEEDYGPKPSYLTANYRSTAHIIAAANAVITPAQERMKVKQPIHIDPARKEDPPGGPWEAIDPVVRGRVQILPVGDSHLSQAQVVMEEFLRLQELAPHRDWSRCAVVAREWKWLYSVRAFCEACGIPVQMGNETIPSVRHLRETRALMAWLRKRTPRLVDGKALAARLAAQPSGPWYDLLRQAVEDYTSETGGGEHPVDSCMEWLAEWSRDVRQRQQGLLLVTAHRAKGLEFDHVAVLDGSWDRVTPGEDPDAQRRLYYVAMTRARHTLLLARFHDTRTCGFQDGLVHHPAVLWREPIPIHPPSSHAMEYRHIRAGLQDVVLSFAGYRPGTDPIHAAIAALSPGDPLAARVGSHGRWELLDTAGHVVGRLAKGFQPPKGMRCRSATVLAVIVWSRAQSEPNYQRGIQCDSWEVVVPELVFEPEWR